MESCSAETIGGTNLREQRKNEDPEEGQVFPGARGGGRREREEIEVRSSRTLIRRKAKAAGVTSLDQNILGKGHNNIVEGPL